MSKRCHDPDDEAFDADAADAVLDAAAAGGASGVVPSLAEDEDSAEAPAPSPASLPVVASDVDEAFVPAPEA